ncbi:hypothetical protein Cs7R123_07180 [Catellatospora sp. TT07R-123]|uniref:hypothetical protein n=1 Tax=Catellatospora sp. TT07R-123 TaxID=2733863 RepID=UPI001B0C3D58|nr:hypothetical protein [Catellatospora sp. TT07R-123]GHJ43376.1 hypothetical protein Cs7R123_07180 [Catellatospora sp. TT07R-123]
MRIAELTHPVATTPAALRDDQTAKQLRADLASGAWDAGHGALRDQSAFIGSLRLIVGHP